MINNNGENSPKTKYTNVNKSSYLNIIDNEYNEAFRNNLNYSSIIFFLIYLFLILVFYLFFYINYNKNRNNFNKYTYTKLFPEKICKKYIDIFNICLSNVKNYQNRNEICQNEGDRVESCYNSLFVFNLNFQPYLKKYKYCKTNQQSCNMLYNDIKYYSSFFRDLDFDIIINNI
jgi:hypothetical protein